MSEGKCNQWFQLVTPSRSQTNYLIGFTFASHWFVKTSKLLHELAENGSQVALFIGSVTALVFSAVV